MAAGEAEAGTMPGAPTRVTGASPKGEEGPVSASGAAPPAPPKPFPPGRFSFRAAARTSRRDCTERIESTVSWMG